MAVCERCNKEMSSGTSCAGGSFNIGGLEYFPVKFGSEMTRKGIGIEQGNRCHDCGVSVGGLHHRGCDVEQCPKCGDQLLFCACWG